MSDLTLDTPEIADEYPEWKALQRVAQVMREEAGRLPDGSVVASHLEVSALRLLRVRREGPERRGRRRSDETP